MFSVRRSSTWRRVIVFSRTVPREIVVSGQAFDLHSPSIASVLFPPRSHPMVPSTRTMTSQSVDQTATGLSFWDSHGDYEADERHHLQLLSSKQEPSIQKHSSSSQPSSSLTPPLLYQHQSTLPRLPVPSLQDTIDRFLPTALPLCESEEERAHLIASASSFVRQAQSLQTRLHDRASIFSQSTSWLQLWWNQTGYLQPRIPNATYINYFFRQANPAPVSFTRRAAWVLRETALFATPILRGTHSPDLLGKRQIPLCSAQYKYLFQACRIPQLHQDVYRVYYFDEFDDINLHALVHSQQYAVVAYRDQFYKVPLVDPRTHQVYSTDTLERALQTMIVQRASAAARSSPPSFGWLTAADRDTWANEYNHLQQSSPQMAQALETLQSGLCIVNLEEENTSHLHQPAWMAQQLWHGRHQHTGNRWWDKSLQIVVAGNDNESILGCIGEHSMADGMPVSTGIWKHLLENTGTNSSIANEQPISLDDLPPVEPIFQSAWEELSDTQQECIQQGVSKARTSVSDTIAYTECYVLEFKDYGAKEIAKAGFSVDAFGQLAMQLASIKAFGKKVATYESSQTRSFLHGRTETIRSVSPEATAFCRAMLDKNNEGNKANNLTLLLLEAAIKSHVTYSRNAAQAMVVDRHFMGLAMSADQDDAMPDLFSDPVFVRSKKWRLSTSTLPGTVPGFGPVEPDGIGVGYDLQRDCLYFTITGWKDRDDYARKMHESLRWALREMAGFLKLSSEDHGRPIKSRL